MAELEPRLRLLHPMSQLPPGSPAVDLCPSLGSASFWPSGTCLLCKWKYSRHKTELDGFLVALGAFPLPIRVLGLAALRMVGMGVVAWWWLGRWTPT